MLMPVAVTLACSLRIAARLAEMPTVTRDGPRRRRSDSADVRSAWSRLPPRRLADRRGHRAVGALFPHRRLPGAAVVRAPSRSRCYNAVFRLVEALRLFPAAVLAVTLPSLVPRRRPAAAGARRGRRSRRSRSSRPRCCGLAAGWLIPLVYGGRYAAAVPAFRVLLLSFPLLSLNYALTHQLIGWDGQRAYAALCALALAVNVALNARLIPHLVDRRCRLGHAGTEVVLTAGCGVALWMRARAASRAPARAGDGGMTW